MTWRTTLSCALFVGPPSGRGGSSTLTLKNLTIQEFSNVQYVRKKWWVNARWKGINRVTGKKFRETNGEHHEALHHTLKTMERDRNLYMKRNHGGVVHQQKSHQSISIKNALSAGKAKLRLRKSSTSSNSPKSSPRKGLFNHSKSFLTNFLNRIDE